MGTHSAYQTIHQAIMKVNSYRAAADSNWCYWAQLQSSTCTACLQSSRQAQQLIMFYLTRALQAALDPTAAAAVTQQATAFGELFVGKAACMPAMRVGGLTGFARRSGPM
jgi:hypothetical protein